MDAVCPVCEQSLTGEGATDDTHAAVRQEQLVSAPYPAGAVSESHQARSLHAEQTEQEASTRARGLSRSRGEHESGPGAGGLQAGSSEQQRNRHRRTRSRSRERYQQDRSVPLFRASRAHGAGGASHTSARIDEHICTDRAMSSLVPDASLPSCARVSFQTPVPGLRTLPHEPRCPVRVSPCPSVALRNRHRARGSYPVAHGPGSGVLPVRLPGRGASKRGIPLYALGPSTSDGGWGAGSGSSVRGF